MRPDKLFITLVGLFVVVVTAILEGGFMAGLTGFFFMLVMIERDRRKHEIRKINRINHLHK